jgi:hypothetical protein
VLLVIEAAAAVLLHSHEQQRRGYLILSLFILIINEVIYFGNDLDHSLIKPNQIHHNGFVV